MNHGKKLHYFLPSLFTAMFLVCGAAGAQSNATLQKVSSSCTSPSNGHQCQVTISWNDPNNLYPVDYVTESSPQLGTFTVGYGNSGGYTAYNVQVPVAFQLYDGEGNWLAAISCYNSGSSIECQ